MENIDKQYEESLEFLYSQLPMFSRVGAAAYKPGLDRTIALDNLFGNPHRKFRSIHIAGTNGKGSTSHMLASVLQSHGHKTALYTSPHLVDFRERIRINGEMIPKEKVIDFTRRWHESDNDINPSFFELTMTMAFDWFASENVDIAVIEVGMGGRLDSTNIITPIASAITNISFDHTQFLGDTLAKIAGEKAGIMKPGVTTVIGEATEETETVFRNHAVATGATLKEAYNTPLLTSFTPDDEWGWQCSSPLTGDFHLPLAGEYQKKNINTLLNILNILPDVGIELNKEKTRDGIEKVVENTGLMGRWMRMSSSPLTICDTGHNEAGLRYNLHQLNEIMQKRHKTTPDAKLFMIIGFVSDKDVDHILPLFPKDAVYYITQAAIPRAMPVDILADKCEANGITIADKFDSVKEAAAAATNCAAPSDVIYIGGSTFVVADYLK